MKHDLLKQYVSLRSALQEEKARLEARLQQLHRALSETPTVVTVAPEPATSVQRPIKSPMSMKAAVLQVTSGHPMTKPEILAAIQKLGFRTASKKPGRMLDNLLYGKNPKFKNENGRFSPIAAAAESVEVEPATVKGSRKRKMSEAGRARLSALAKARWAKIKKAGGRKLKAG